MSYLRILSALFNRPAKRLSELNTVQQHIVRTTLAARREVIAPLGAATEKSQQFAQTRVEI